MANYIIIGGDNKEYGPVTEAEVRQWIAEGRLSAESRVKAESDAEFRTLGQFPEFAAALQPRAAAPASLAPQRPEDFLGRDYELDIGGCIARGWETYKGNFGTLFAAFLIAFLIQCACGMVLNLPFNRFVLSAPLGIRIGYSGFYSAVLSLVNGPLAGGLFLVYLRAIRREGTGLGELFAGFQRAYLQLFLGSLMLSLISFGCMLPFQFVWQSKLGPIFMDMQRLQSDPAGLQNLFPQMMSASVHSLPVLLICMIPLTFLSVSLAFTVPLIIDKQMSFTEAMATSWRMVMKHWWPVFGLLVVVGLIMIAGILACCVGFLFTMPIGLAALMVAYETIFGAPQN